MSTAMDHAADSGNARDWVVVTDLDGTLLDDRYDFSAAVPVLRQLRSLDVPVVPCTSKTAEEVEQFCAAAGLLRCPYIVENGCALYVPAGHSQWQLPPPGEAHNNPEVTAGPAGYQVLPLGWSHQRLRPLLDELAAALHTRFTALADLPLAQLVDRTGLSAAAAAQAARRCWSVPFLLEEGDAIEPVEQLAAERGLNVLQGNRFAHLIAPGSDKGRAMAFLRTMDRRQRSVLALGDSPNDEAMLAAADHAVVVPGPGGPHPRLRPAIAAGRYHLAPAPHGEGWAAAVRTALGLPSVL